LQVLSDVPSRFHVLGNDYILVAVTQPAGKDEPGEEVRGRLRIWVARVLRQMPSFLSSVMNPWRIFMAKAIGKAPLCLAFAPLQSLDGLQVLDAARVG
jgi:hypothetical protein